MQTSDTFTPKPRPWWLTTAGALLVAGILSSMVAWWLIAVPVLTVSNVDKHGDHFAYTFLRAISGIIMLFLGLVNIYIGTTNRFFRFHEVVGATYLLGGSFGALQAIFIVLGPYHKREGSDVFTNLTVSLLCLARAWLHSAAISYRAVRNGRYDAHGEWIIRSYVLVWSFVFCRLASRVPAVSELGGGEAFIWLSWVAPIVICEFALQWRSGSKLTQKDSEKADPPRPAPQSYAHSYLPIPNMPVYLQDIPCVPHILSVSLFDILHSKFVISQSPDFAKR